MSNKFHIGQKVRPFYGLHANWGQGRDELLVVTGVFENNDGSYRYECKEVSPKTQYNSGCSCPEKLLISEVDWQKLPLWYRQTAFTIQTSVIKHMKEMGYYK